MPSSSSFPRRILVIEDDPDIANLVRLHLRDAGFAVDVARDGATGLRKALGPEPYDLLVLDLTLPGGVDGLEICRRVRAKAVHVLLLMLTARSSELDRVLGLEMGADDCLVKPFSIRELLARSIGVNPGANGHKESEGGRRSHVYRSPRTKGKP